MLRDRRVHTTLPSRDPSVLRHFYEEVLGFTPLAEREGAVLYRAGDGSLFALSRTGITARAGHTQMAFTVPDIEAEVA
jgi:catechol-2,3-dioxygenase